MWEMNYDEAAEYWNKREKNNKHMDNDILMKRIEVFINAHNTCALATASEGSVRNTPIEYNYFDGCFYFFSEGGKKFRCLKDNKNVGIAIFENYSGFSNLKSLQVEGIADILEPFSDDYIKAAEKRKLPLEALKKLDHPMNLIKVVPKSLDFLDSDLKKDGFSVRQHLEI